MKHWNLILLASLGVAWLAAPTVSGQTTPFLYQGRLNLNLGGTMSPPPSAYAFELRSRLYDAPTGGNLLAETLVQTSITDSNGSFTAELAFPSPALWNASGEQFLEMAVRPQGSSGPLTTLLPRQMIYCQPKALHALDAERALTVSTGAVSTVQLQDGAVTAVKIAPGHTVRSLNGLRDDVQLMAGEGLVLSPVGNTLRLSSPRGCLDYTNCYWNLLGNGNITSNVHFLGTVAGEWDPLDLRVEGRRALRVQPDALFIRCDSQHPEVGGFASSPSLVGGYSGNSIAAGVAGSVISGGGVAEGGIPCIGPGPYPNVINRDGHFANIGGGLGNFIGGGCSSIGGGIFNEAPNGANYSVISGGSYNHLDATDQSAIGGGTENQIHWDADRAVIAGGGGNTISTNADASAIGGGDGNRIETNINCATIGGGERNTVAALAGTVSGGTSNSILTLSPWSTIAGGADNTVQGAATAGSIGGGSGNAIRDNADYSVIGGGRNNGVETNAQYVSIGGGYRNSVQSGSSYSTVPGGYQNTIRTNSDYSAIGGGYANEIRPDATYTTIGGGYNNTVSTNADYATIPGGRYAAAVNYGQQAYAGGRFANDGDAQTSLYVLRRTVTTGNLTELFLDGASRRMTIPNNSTWTFDVLLTVRGSDGYSAGFQIRGVIQNNNGVTTMVDPGIEEILGDGPALMITAHAMADDVNDALAIKVTGEAPHSLRFVAVVRTAEVSY